MEQVHLAVLDPHVQSPVWKPSSALVTPAITSKRDFQPAHTCLLKMVTGKQNKSYFNVEELHSLPALNTACSWTFPRAHLSSQHAREPSEECGLEAQALGREERSFHLDSSALHTPVSWKYKKDCFYFIAEYMPQLAGSCFNKQLHVKGFSCNAANKTQQLTISRVKDPPPASAQREGLWSGKNPVLQSSCLSLAQAQA